MWQKRCWWWLFWWCIVTKHLKKDSQEEFLPSLLCILMEMPSIDSNSTGSLRDKKTGTRHEEMQRKSEKSKTGFLSQFIMLICFLSSKNEHSFGLLCYYSLHFLSIQVLFSVQSCYFFLFFALSWLNKSFTFWFMIFLHLFSFLPLAFIPSY